MVGHLGRLPTETPAKQALKEALRPTKRPQGRPTTTWLQTVNKDLKELNITNMEKAIDLAQDRTVWRGVVESTKST